MFVIFDNKPLVKSKFFLKKFNYLKKNKVVKFQASILIFT